MEAEILKQTSKIETLARELDQLKNKKLEPGHKKLKGPNEYTKKTTCWYGKKCKYLKDNSCWFKHYKPKQTASGPSAPPKMEEK